MKLSHIPAYTILDLLHPTRCDICGKYPLIPTIDAFGHKVCFKHRKIGKIGKCYFCGSFCFINQSTMVAPNVFRCQHCNENIPQISEFGQMASYIRDYYRGCGVGELPRFWVNQVRYEELSQTQDRRVCLAYAQKQAANSYEICLYEGLSRMIYLSTLAHEVLHLWLWEHGLNPADDVREGFCNLGSYMVLKQIGTPEARLRMKMYERDSDIIYGNGFRKMKAIFDKGGWPTVIDLVLTVHEFK